MSQSVRFVRRGIHGRVGQNYNWDAIKSRTSVVHITAAEIIPPDPTVPPVLKQLGEPNQNFMYHVGDANVWVSNVSPHREDHFGGEPGGVEFIINVNSGTPIDVAITITVEDDFPVDVKGL